MARLRRWDLPACRAIGRFGQGISAYDGYDLRNRYSGDAAVDLKEKCNSDIVDDVRLVLDTNVVVAAMRSPTGASAALIRAVRRGRATLLLSPALLLEYEAVCQAPEHRHAAGLSRAEVDVVLDVLCRLAETVTSHYRWRPQLRDPADEMVLEAAVNGRADALVTFNRRDFGMAPARFGVEVTSPGETLRRIVA